MVSAGQMLLCHARHSLFFCFAADEGLKSAIKKALEGHVRMLKVVIEGGKSGHSLKSLFILYVNDQASLRVLRIYGFWRVVQGILNAECPCMAHTFVGSPPQSISLCSVDIPHSIHDVY